MKKLLWIGLIVLIGLVVALVRGVKGEQDGGPASGEAAKGAAKQPAERGNAGSGAPALVTAPEGSAAPAPSAEEADSRPVPTCAEALAKGLSGLSDTPEAEALQGQLHAIYLRRCAEDRWPVAALRCFASTTGMTGMKLCRGRLPPEQAKKLTTEIMSAMAGGAGAPPPPRPSGPVPVGGPPASPPS